MISTVWLKINPGVVLSPTIESGILKLEPYFEKHRVSARVTSGVRGPADQLRIIQNALKKRGLDLQYSDAFKGLDEKIMLNGREVYAWQPGWSKLLNVGYIVNPPYAAECLMDYYRPGSVENRKGKIIGQTPHVTEKCIDIGGGANGIANKLKVIEDVYRNKIIKSYLAEHGNNAVHIDFF